MTTMLERAARALCEAMGEVWDNEPSTWKSIHLSRVRAVLVAVREPDDEFSLAAADGHDTYWNYADNGEPSGPSETFTAIVDAILAGDA